MEDTKPKVGGRAFFILFFLYVVLQGAVRKWMFPSMGTPLFLLQFILVFIVFLSTPQKAQLKEFKLSPPFQGLLMLYVAFAALEIFNLRGTSNLLVPVYGFVMHLAFVPFLYYIPRIITDEETFNTYLTWLAFAMLPLFFLGISQYFSPPGAFINRYAVDKEEGTYEVAIGGGGRVRIAGTFSYLATYASFLTFILHLMFYGLIVSLLRKKLNWWYALAFGMGVMNIFMTGSRGPTLFYGFTEGLTILILALSGQARFLKNLFPLAGLLIAGFFILQLSEAGSASTGNFFDRLTGLNDLDRRIDDSFSPFKFADKAGPIGYGIGTAQFSMESYLTNRWEMPGYWEEEGERIVVEFGVIGYIIVMALRWAIFISCFQVYRRVQKLEFKILALQMTMYQIPFMLNLQTNIFNYIDGMFYWMAIGFVYFARQMDKMNAKAQLELANKVDTSLSPLQQ